MPAPGAAAGSESDPQRPLASEVLQPRLLTDGQSRSNPPTLRSRDRDCGNPDVASTNKCATQAPKREGRRESAVAVVLVRKGSQMAGNQPHQRSLMCLAALTAFVTVWYLTDLRSRGRSWKIQRGRATGLKEGLDEAV